MKDVPPPVLADLYLRAGAAPVRPPSKATIWRVITDADAEVFDATVGSWMMSCQAARHRDGAGGGDPPGLVPVRLDGKAIRGAKDAEGSQRHLLAALAGAAAQSPVIAAQAEVKAKTSEVPMATAVLGQIDLNSAVVTADALHTVKAAAEFIRQAGGEFVLPVKENRQAMFDALDALPWDQVPIAHTETDRGHGRITTRQAAPSVPECAQIRRRPSSSSAVSVTVPARWGSSISKLIPHWHDKHLLTCDNDTRTPGRTAGLDNRRSTRSPSFPSRNTPTMGGNNPDRYRLSGMRPCRGLVTVTKYGPDPEN